MNPLKDILLNAYYLATLPQRRRAARDRAARGMEPVSVLFYHRVADTHPNDWTMSTATFARQIRWLKERFDVVDLAEAQRRIASGRNSRPTVCITFDDGYAENMQFAVPLLLKEQLPFTYFVSTNHVFGNRPFPHDVAAGQPLAPNTLSQLREMAAAGVEIGAHNRNHVHLGVVSADVMQDEIVGSKHDLEQALEREVRYFAFPYGQPSDLSTAAFQIAYQAGYRGVCSAYGGYNFPGDDPFHLRRIHADCELVRVKNWLTVDPRKLRNPIHFDPGDFRRDVAPPVLLDAQDLEFHAESDMSACTANSIPASQRASARARFAGGERVGAAGGERRAAERRLRPRRAVLPLARAGRARPVGHGVQLPAARGAAGRAGPAGFVRPLPGALPPAAAAADVSCGARRFGPPRSPPRPSASSPSGRRVFPGSCSAGPIARRW